MRRLLLVSTAVLATVGSAAAADLPARYPVKAPPVVAPVFTWTGFYIGGFVGGAWTDGDVSAYDRSPIPFVANRGWGYSNDSSFIGGGTVGINWQPVGSPWVLGLEGEIGYLSLSGSAYNPLATTLYATSSVGDWYGVIAGRLGYAWDRVLLYAKGGAAFVNVENTIVGPTFAVSASETKATWAVGGGLEWAFDQNWSIKAEYLYLGLNDTQTTAATVGATTYYWDHDNPGIHTAKIGINYRFGAAAPVVARY